MTSDAYSLKEEKKDARVVCLLFTLPFLSQTLNLMLIMNHHVLKMVSCTKDWELAEVPGVAQVPNMP